VNSAELSHFFQGQTVVVTVACGFIGSHVARQLHAHGAKVRGIKRSEADFARRQLIRLP